jgi:hypothetical protein
MYEYDKVFSMDEETEEGILGAAADEELEEGLEDEDEEVAPLVEEEEEL